MKVNTVCLTTWLTSDASFKSNDLDLMLRAVTVKFDRSDHSTTWNMAWWKKARKFLNSRMAIRPYTSHFTLKTQTQSEAFKTHDWTIIKFEILSISEVWQRLDLYERSCDVLDPPGYRREARRSPVQAVWAGVWQMWLRWRANILSPDVVPRRGRQGMSTYCAILQ